MICCFTGLRPPKLPFSGDENRPEMIAVKSRLNEAISAEMHQRGVTQFITGMAMGIDIIAAELVLIFMESHPGITLHAAIPFPGQEKRWPLAWRQRYHAVLERCGKITYISDSYTRRAMMRRNIFMVDNSSSVIAVWDGSPGGTANTVKYALSKSKPVNIIHPLPVISIEDIKRSVSQYNFDF